MPIKRLPSQFDSSRPLVATRFFPAHDMDFQPGQAVNLTPLGDERQDGTLETDTALRLWLVGYIDYESNYLPTPAETAEEEAARVVVLEELGGGWYLITTPWGPEGERIQGKDAAEKRRAELIAKGNTKGVTITGGDGGWYEVNAPWLSEPIKVQGSEAAAVEEAMLIQDGPPAGWKPETEEEKAARLQADADRQAAAEEAERKAEQDAIDAAERDRAAALEAAGITVTAKGGGYYEVASPALEEPAKVRGKDAVDAKVAELLAAYQATLGDSGNQQEAAKLEPVEGDAALVLVTVGDNDWTVTAPWLDAPEVFSTVEAAEARQAELRAAGAPEGWTPPAGEGATAEAPAEGVAQAKAEGEA
jgi:hypothetical protein